MLRMTHNMCKIFFISYCLLFGPCIMCVYFMSIFFLDYLHGILRKYLSVVSSYCVCVVFVLFFLHLSVCYVPLCLIPHPIFAITNLRIHGMYVCVCVYVCMYVCMYEHWKDSIYHWNGRCM